MKTKTERKLIPEKTHSEKLISFFWKTCSPGMYGICFRKLIQKFYFRKFVPKCISSIPIICSRNPFPEILLYKTYSENMFQKF